MFVPVIQFYASAYYQDSKPAELIMDLPLCRKCANELKIEDLLSDEIRELIEMTLKALGKVEPDHSRTKFRLMAESSSEVALLRTGKTAAGKAKVSTPEIKLQ